MYRFTSQAVFCSVCFLSCVIAAPALGQGKGGKGGMQPGQMGMMVGGQMGGCKQKGQSGGMQIPMQMNGGFQSPFQQMGGFQNPYQQFSGYGQTMPMQNPLMQAQAAYIQQAQAAYMQQAQMLYMQNAAAMQNQYRLYGAQNSSLQNATQSQRNYRSK